MAANEWDPLLPNSAGRNYTGILTKSIVYALTLCFFLIGEFCSLPGCRRHRRLLAT
jgi:hypothetical protein